MTLVEKQNGQLSVRYPPASMSKNNICFHCAPVSSCSLGSEMRIELKMAFVFTGRPSVNGSFMGIQSSEGNTTKAAGAILLSNPRTRSNPISSITDGISVCLNGRSIYTPFSYMGNSLVAYSDTRGAKFEPVDWYLNEVPSTKSQCTATFIYDFLETLSIGPFIGNQPLLNVETLDVMLQLGDPRNAWQDGCGDDISFEASIPSNGAIIELCYTPLGSRLSAPSINPFVDYAPHSKSLGIKPFLVEELHEMYPLSLRKVPEKLFVYVMAKRTGRPDAYCNISKIALNWDSVSSVYEKDRLHQICSDNGFRDYVNQPLGSIVCLKMGKDVPLRPNHDGVLSLFVSVTACNPYDDDTARWSLYIVAENAGRLSIERSGVKDQ
jgi:hypothetical protein